MSIPVRGDEENPVRVRVEAATDIGLKRSRNEDQYGIWAPEDPEQRRRHGLLLAIADGMGGARGGEVASRLAIETVLHTYREAPGVSVADDLRAAVLAANRRIHRESLTNSDLAGMGTTCTAVVLREGEIQLAHVGDSRAYLVRAGRIRQLTQDHSLVGQLVRDRHLTPAEARTDPRRNVVIRSVGIGPDVEVDVEHVGERLQAGDIVILSTDGLHGLLDDEEIGAAASGPDLGAACRRLIELARERGGPDNITVILARAEAEPAVGGAEAGAEEAGAIQPGPALLTSGVAAPASAPDERRSLAAVRWSRIGIVAALLLLVVLLLVLALRRSLRPPSGV